MTNDEIILSTLKKSDKPLSAYEILSKLKSKIKSPPIVYRALARLEKEGKIHQIQSTSTYAVCHGHHEDNKLNAIIVCSDCGKVSEVGNVNISPIIKEMIKKSDLKINAKSMELIGSCSDGCR